ncbi:unnamed protein product [Cylindrotheca closterium]|uniref:Uncharacterized protein n=1 Tax=Cylindrotheca closterium TaxID=2856 RepID=A0AAD2FND5_9STRA|nr:unnamed protein product [Cylindrotheca closterium]
MPARLSEREDPNGNRPNRSTSRSPMMSDNSRRRRSQEARSRTPPSGDGRRSLTPPPRQGSASPARRRVLRKGSSVRNPDKPQISPKGNSTRRLPKYNSFTGITDPNTRKSSNKSMPSNGDTSTVTSTNSTRSARQPKRKGSMTADSKISPSADRIASEPAGGGGRHNNNNNNNNSSNNSSSNNTNNSNNSRQTKRINSLGNIGQQPRTQTPKRMMSLQLASQQQLPRTQAPKRMNSLSSNLDAGQQQQQQPRTQPPKRMMSLGNIGGQQQPRIQAPKRMNSLSSNLSPKDSALIRIRSPSLRKERSSGGNQNKKELRSNDSTVSESENGSSSNRQLRSKSKSASITPARSKRWNFTGSVSMSEDDAEYGDSASVGAFEDDPHDNSNSNRITKHKVGEVDSDSEWDSDDSDEEYSRMMRNNYADTAAATMTENGSLPPPNQKRLQKRKHHDALFPDDKWWQKCLRHFRILPPIPNEGRTRRSVRKLIWATLLFDVLVAIVTIATYSGTVTMCCNQVTMASIPSIDWNTFIKVVSYIYLVGIFLEIHPVVREGPIPWNLLNPIFGSLLSFAVFVDDSKAEAIGIWILEIASVILEGFTYLRLKKLYQREERRLEKLDGFLKDEQSSSNEHRKGGQYKKNAYLRERRILRIEHAQNKSKLRYHFVGVSVNFVLVSLTLLLMILVARGRGMCLVAGQGLDLFNPDQRSRCFECLDKSQGWKERCEVCEEGPNADPTMNDPIQCFYPYF